MASALTAMFASHSPIGRHVAAVVVAPPDAARDAGGKERVGARRVIADDARPSADVAGAERGPGIEHGGRGGSISATRRPRPSQTSRGVRPAVVDRCATRSAASRPICCVARAYAAATSKRDRLPPAAPLHARPPRRAGRSVAPSRHRSLGHARDECRDECGGHQEQHDARHVRILPGRSRLVKIPPPTFDGPPVPAHIVKGEACLAQAITGPAYERVSRER